ncbi:MAG: MBL fold metallo-hydrolase [Thermodesulfobacteriota bacterium]
MKRIYLVRVPVPFVLEFVNLYLIEGDSGLTLIDCGPKTKDTYEYLNNYLQGIHRSFRDIKNVIISHYHVDHYGFSGELKKLSDVSIIMHEMEVPLVDSYDSTFTYWVDEGLKYGMPAGFVKDIKRLYKLVPGMISHARVDEGVKDGQKFSNNGDSYEVIWTPGHSPGHICLYNREKKIAFTGDHLLGDITPNPGDPAFGSVMRENSLEYFMDSLNKLKKYDIERAFPAHGGIIEDPKKRVDEILAHHEERLEHVLDVMGNDYKTAYDISLKMKWIEDTVLGSKLPDSEKPLALVEAVIHLELLRKRGRVERIYEAPHLLFKRV